MPESPKERVLVIDDDASIRTMLKEFLEEHGFDVTVASSGSHGLQLAGSLRFKAAIVDVQLPDIDGFNLGRYREEMRIIFMSGHSDWACQPM